MGEVIDSSIDLTDMSEAAYDRLGSFFALAADRHQDLGGDKFLISTAADISRELTNRVFGIEPDPQDTDPLPVELQPANGHPTAWQRIKNGRIKVLDPKHVAPVIKFLNY